MSIHTPHPARGPRRQTAARVLFVSDQWGYGTATMGMAVAAELEGVVSRIFAGQGPAYELARRFPYEGLLAVDTMTEPLPRELDELIGTSQGIVSVMNGPVARRAAEREVPCVYVDCLLWMGAPPPAIPGGVPYIHEAFPGTAERLDVLRDDYVDAEIVGPLVVRPDRARVEAPDAVLINFGGLSCVMLSPATLIAYAETMAQCAIQALDHWEGRVVIAAGQHVIDGVDMRLLRSMHPRVDVVDLGHDAYLAELRRSWALISSAGMHAIYEACAMGVPYVGLPAQNSSQSPALQALRRLGATQALDWNDLYAMADLDQSDQELVHRRIAASIHEFRNDVVARARLVRHLHRTLDSRRLARLAEAQAQFFRTQGPLGAPRVAARILQMLKAPLSSPARHEHG